jgi:hypothetical protein
MTNDQQEDEWIKRWDRLCVAVFISIMSIFVIICAYMLSK